MMYMYVYPRAFICKECNAYSRQGTKGARPAAALDKAPAIVIQ